MTHTKNLVYINILIICLSFNKEAHSQDKIDFKSLINTLQSGTLSDPMYDKFIAGDKYYHQSDSYVSDQIAVEGKKKMQQKSKVIIEQLETDNKDIEYKSDNIEELKRQAIKYFNHLESNVVTISDYRSARNPTSQLQSSYNGEEEEKALIRQTFRIYNKYYAQLNSIGFIEPNYNKPQIIPEGFWKAMWSTAISYLTGIWQ